MAGNVAGITKVKVDKVVIVSGESLSGEDEFYVIQKAILCGKLLRKLMATAVNIRRSLKQIKK